MKLQIFVPILSSSLVNKIKLFTDGSVNPQLKTGFASYLKTFEDNPNLEDLKKTIHIKRFDNTSSTTLEIQGLLWALHELKDDHCDIVIYTDCQNILTLKNRRARFETKNYLTKKGTLIANHELYKEFYALTDTLSCEFIKVKGHKQKDLKDKIDDIFSLVDKASRNALREFNT